MGRCLWWLSWSRRTSASMTVWRKRGPRQRSGLCFGRTKLRRFLTGVSDRREEEAPVPQEQRLVCPECGIATSSQHSCLAKGMPRFVRVRLSPHPVVEVERAAFPQVHSQQFGHTGKKLKTETQYAILFSWVDGIVVVVVLLFVWIRTLSAGCRCSLLSRELRYGAC